MRYRIDWHVVTRVLTLTRILYQCLWNGFVQMLTRCVPSEKDTFCVLLRHKRDINQVYLTLGTSAMATKTALYFDHVRALCWNHRNAFILPSHGVFHLFTTFCNHTFRLLHTYFIMILESATYVSFFFGKVNSPKSRF